MSVNAAHSKPFVTWNDNHITIYIYILFQSKYVCNHFQYMNIVMHQTPHQLINEYWGGCIATCILFLSMRVHVCKQLRWELSLSWLSQDKFDWSVQACTPPSRIISGRENLMVGSLELVILNHLTHCLHMAHTSCSAKYSYHARGHLCHTIDTVVNHSLFTMQDFALWWLDIFTVILAITQHMWQVTCTAKLHTLPSASYFMGSHQWTRKLYWAILVWRCYKELLLWWIYGLLA